MLLILTEIFSIKFLELIIYFVPNILLIKVRLKTNMSCAAHDIGTVTLQVVIDGRPVSTTAIFEYRQHEFPLTISSLSMSHTQSLLKFHLLQKLDSIEDYLQQPSNRQTDQPLVYIIIFTANNYSG